MKLLICSNFVPYDTVAHAGGQNHNYYLKKLINEKKFEIHLISFASSKESEKIDLNQYSSLQSSIIFLYGKANIFTRLFRKIIYTAYRFFTLSGLYDLVDGYGKYRLKKELLRLKNNGYTPDIVELNWTQIIYLVTMIQKIFPQAKYYAVEQDVTFLRFEREFHLKKNILKRQIVKFKYTYFKKKELTVLKKFDAVFTFTNKDKNLLENINNTHVLTPYFHNFSFPIKREKNNTILFYGAMSRPENYLAAIWFIEHVFLKLKNNEFIFTVLGSDPHPKLLAYQNSRIIITGYQKDISQWLENSLCLVAPLQLGAGIKIKMLEALSAGMVILASNVAAEGIEITDNVHYFRCNNAEEYKEKIGLIQDNPALQYSIGKSARNFIQNNYNLEKSFSFYTKTLFSILKQQENV
jgi:glycosyltransferase involved in cell wall biosynthesis